MYLFFFLPGYKSSGDEAGPGANHAGQGAVTEEEGGAGAGQVPAADADPPSHHHG